MTSKKGLPSRDEEWSSVSQVVWEEEIILGTKALRHGECDTFKEEKIQVSGLQHRAGERRVTR